MGLDPISLSAARQAGYSDADIAAQASQNDPRIGPALKGGYSLDELASAMGQKAAQAEGPAGQAAGAPSDLHGTAQSGNFGAASPSVQPYAVAPLNGLATAATAMNPAIPAVDLAERITKGQALGTPGNRLGPIAKTAADAATVGMNLVPGLGATEDGLSAVGRSILAGNLGSGVAQGTVGAAGGGPIPQAIAALTGGVLGGNMGLRGTFNPLNAFANAPLPTRAPSTAFGELSPGQSQILAGQRGLTPEIEREALNRASNPIQALAGGQADTLQGTLRQQLGQVAPIQNSIGAASAFQGKFDNAMDAAKAAMSDITDKIAAADASGQTSLNPAVLKSAAQKAITDAGWQIGPDGKIVQNLAAKGFSPQAAGVMQSYLNALDGVTDVSGLRNLRQNFGQAIAKAGQDSGIYADSVKSGMYKALSGVEQASLPPELAASLQDANAKYSGLKGLQDNETLSGALSKDPTKFWDSLLSSAGKDKDFMGNVQQAMTQAGMKPEDLQSVAVSNIMDKVQAALSSPAKDEVGRLSAGIKALQDEVNRIPINARQALLGDAHPWLQQTIQDGQAIRDWANRLPNGSNTARMMVPQVLENFANHIESLGSHFGIPGRMVSGGIGKMLRGGGSIANDVSTANYLKGAQPSSMSLAMRGLPWMQGILAAAARL